MVEVTTLIGTCVKKHDIVNIAFGLCNNPSLFQFHTLHVDNYFNFFIQKTVNQDGLLYADLEFASQPKDQKRLVIRGLDDMTEYAEVDLTRKADPLPDSDNEEKTK